MVFAGEIIRVRDMKGVRYLARLLASPGREFHVLDLVAVEQGRGPRAQETEVARVGAGCR